MGVSPCCSLSSIRKSLFLFPDIPTLTSVRTAAPVQVCVTCVRGISEQWWALLPSKTNGTYRYNWSYFNFITSYWFSLVKKSEIGTR